MVSTIHTIMFVPTSANILGIRIDEPVTTLTDLLVAAVCFFSSYKIFSWHEREKEFLYLKYYFLMMGIATTLGGLLGHGFLYLFSFSWKLPGWLTSMLAVMFIERSSIEQVSPLISLKVAKYFRIINLVELLIFIIATYSTLNFFFVEVHSAYGLLFVVANLQLFNFYKTRNTASKNFLIAVAISAVAALVFMNKVSFHKWYNYFDISHTLMALSAYFFYRAARELKNLKRKRP